MNQRIAKSILTPVVVCAVMAALVAGSAIAQTGSITITTDRPQYQIGDTALVCYTVAGPGSVTITDMQPNGMNQVFWSDSNNDGSGDCIYGEITPPSGKECLDIAATSGGTTGTSSTCFQVVVPSTSGSSGASQDCGQVSVLGGQVTSSGSQADENCFFQAYQQCQPATLQVTISGVDAGMRHSFSLASSGGTCVITDAAQTFVVPRPPSPATTSTCSGLSQTPDGGLLFASCGGQDVTVPPGS